MLNVRNRSVFFNQITYDTFHLEKQICKKFNERNRYLAIIIEFYVNFSNICSIIHCYNALLYVTLMCRFSDTANGPPPPTGAFAPNNDLQKARRLFEGEVIGAESFVADKDGNVMSVNFMYAAYRGSV